MYKIVRGGESLGMTEALTYIKKAENGCYVLCPEPEASGIAFAGAVYHLAGRADLDGADTVAVERVDAGEELDAVSEAIADSDAMNVDQEYRLILLELDLTDDMSDE